MPIVRVKMEGLDALVKKAGSTQVFLDPINQAIKKGTAIVEADVRSLAPVDTGKTRSNITSRLDVSNTGRATGRVMVDPTPTRNGFRYPFALDNPKGKRRFRYRGAPRPGRLTRRWFTGSLRRKRSQLIALINAAGAEIQQRWGS